MGLVIEWCSVGGILFHYLFPIVYHFSLNTDAVSGIVIMGGGRRHLVNLEKDGMISCPGFSGFYFPTRLLATGVKTNPEWESELS